MVNENTNELPIDIKPSQIEQAITENITLSGASRLLEASALHKLLEDGSPNLPPFLMSSEIDGLNETNPKDSVTRSFEYLSLAIRRLASSDEGHQATDKIDLPEWMTVFPTTRKVSPKAILIGLKKALQSKETLGKEKPLSINLKLVGIQITEDLDLSKIDIPISLRFIGCWIEGALILDRAKVITLDLSGSVISNGISASYLETTGALRLRRTVSLGPVDFSCAKVGATFDATDCLIVPFNIPPPKSAYIGGRGMLNMNQMTVYKDARLIRARVYGGVNLRSARFSNNLFLRNAVLRSPTAVILQQSMSIIRDNFFYGREDNGSTTRRRLVPLHIRAVAQFEMTLGNMLWPDDNDLKFIEMLSSKLINLKNEGDNKSSKSLLFQLLTESVHMPDSAVLAEGLYVKNSLKANGARFSGRVRMKFIKVGKSVSFAGCRFYSDRAVVQGLQFILKEFPKVADVYGTTEKDHPEAVAQTCSQLKRIDAFYTALTSHIRTPVLSHRQEYVLNLRDAEIGGNLDLGKDGRITEPTRSKSSESDIVAELIEKISDKLCDTKEDPYKFIGLFFPRSGDPYKILDVSKNKVSSNKKTVVPLYEVEKKHPPKSDEALRSKYASKVEILNSFSNANEFDIWFWQRQISRISRQADPEFYAFRDNEIESDFYKDKNIYPNGSGLNNPLILNDTKYQPDGKMKEPNGLKERIAFNSRKKVVSKLNSSYGALRSVILVGKISAKGANIKGDLLMNGIIANALDCDILSPVIGSNNTAYHMPDDKPILSIQNAIIGGNCDLRNSVGLHSINAQQVQIGGGLKCASKPKFDPKKDRLAPIRQRSIFIPETYENEAEKIMGEYKFSRAKIGGTAIFVFDCARGPSIDLKEASIGSELLFLPAKGGVELNRKELKELDDLAKSKRKNKSLDKAEGYSQFPPAEINLKGAGCSVLSFPPSAWPLQDGLVIDGFTYNRANDTGPLTAPRRSWIEVKRDAKMNKFRVWPIRIGIFLGILASWFLPLISLKWSEYISQNIGITNFRLLLLLFVGFLFFWLTSRFTRPVRKNGTPLGLIFLKLQRRRFNVRRKYKESQPFEPYTKAASVLRASGRQRSANEVELARLRARREAMSTRFMWPLKLVLWLTEKTTQYGFAVSRALAIFTLSILLGSAGAHFAATKGYVVAVDKNRLELAGDHSFPLKFHDVAAFPSGNNLNSYPEFKSLLYSMDVIIPFFDMGQETHWAIVAPAHARKKCQTKLPFSFKKYLSNTIKELRRKSTLTDLDGKAKIDGAKNKLKAYCVPLSVAPIIPYLFKIFGWLFGSLIVVSIAARIETIIARNEET